jgi:hypothetical protein
MLTPFVTALVIGNCIAGACLVAIAALTCVGMHKNFSERS